MIKVTDYIVKLLEGYGVNHVFLVTGGGAMHLNDSFGQSTVIRKVFHHNEQGCAMAAEGYARVTGKLSVVNVTTGPGGLNTLSGVMGQWTDSVPVLYISGQVKHSTTLDYANVPGLRQMGDQEVDIISVVRPLTKYAAMIRDPKMVRCEVEKAIHIATTGRFGPVWLDIPMNVQGALVDETDLMPYVPPVKSAVNHTAAIKETADLFAAAKRPVIVVGHGVRLARVIEDVRYMLELFRIPAVTTFNGFDILEDNFPLYCGRIGTVGQRAGNFVLQNADIVLFLGTRNNIRQTSYNSEFFARAAKRIAIDIDPAELKKPNLTYDQSIVMDLADFIPAFIESLGKSELKMEPWWLDWCLERKQIFSTVSKQQRDSVRLNPNLFINKLTSELSPTDTVVCGNGTACVATFQSAVIKKGLRLILNSGCASMGYDLPAAIGAACGSGGRVVCLAGDGSLQMNLQELATVSANNLPVKIFYLDNNGYTSIRQTQDGFFGRRYGVSSSTGLLFPETKMLTGAYGIPHYSINEKEDMDDVIKMVLASEGPVFCHVHLDPEHIFEPKLSSLRRPDGSIVSKPLEDMYPFLDRELFKKNMLIPIVGQ